MQSMTGFSRASEENERLRLEVAIRSVNHRHLDVTVRVPEELREHESLVRKVVAEGLTRGRVEVRIDALYLNNEKPQLEVEESAIEALRATIDDLAAKGLIVSELSFTDLLKVPGAVRTSSVLDGVRTGGCRAAEACGRQSAGRGSRGPSDRRRHSAKAPSNEWRISCVA